eukprot:SAG11_NODE_16159_length_555_cov_1.563596_1_plen_185_part_11
MEMVNMCQNRSLEAVPDRGSCISEFDCYCECRSACENAYDLDNKRYNYFFVGLFFGLWYASTMFNCVWKVKERSQLPGAAKLPEPAPIVPTALKTMNNRLFSLLLPAWVCDTLANSIIASLLTYFVRYIVAPEQTAQCISGELSGWRCDSTQVIGFSILALLLTAFLSTPLWLFLERRFGKRSAW